MTSEVLAFQHWCACRLRIAAVDPQEHLVTFDGHTASDSYWGKFMKDGRYLVMNVKEALSEPGEWYLDRKAGELTYLPALRARRRQPRRSSRRGCLTWWSSRAIPPRGASCRTFS